MKITGLNEQMRDLAGRIMTADAANAPLTLKDAIANSLALSSTPDPARTMSIATRIYESNGSIELDQPEIDYAIQLITMSGLPDVAKVLCVTALKRGSE